MKLKPCPFCRTRGEDLSVDFENGAYWVVCDNCGTFGPDKDTEDEAATAWNVYAKRGVVLHD